MDGWLAEQAPVSESTRRLIRDVLEQEVGTYGLERVEVRPDVDHDGDPVLRIEVVYQNPVEPDVLAGLVTPVRSALWDAGERRFPFLHNILPGDEEEFDEEEFDEEGDLGEER